MKKIFISLALAASFFCANSAFAVTAPLASTSINTPTTVQQEEQVIIIIIIVEQR